MSIARPAEDIEYPESDGQPMGETDLHRDWMFRILEILRYRYRGQRVYIASDLLLYYEEGSPAKFVVPDDFIVLDCDPGRRQNYKIWEEKRVPDVVFEVTSRSSKREDTVKKLKIYEAIGIKEYLIYHPTRSYLRQGLSGFRLVNDDFNNIVAEEGMLACESLQLGLRLRGNDLEFVDLKDRSIQLTEAEAEAEARKRESLARENERLGREQEQQAKERELAARMVAEAKNVELAQEILRLRQLIHQLGGDIQASE